MTRSLPPWARTAHSDYLPADVVNRLVHLRRLMLTHSCIYYHLNDSVVSDHQWQSWANELRDLQDACVEYRCIGFYDEAFFDWDGSTGYHLPADGDVMRVAQALLNNPHLPRNRRRVPPAQPIRRKALIA